MIGRANSSYFHEADDCRERRMRQSGDDQEQFKTQIYTALCLALSIGVFLLTIYVILPSEHVEVPDEVPVCEPQLRLLRAHRPQLAGRRLAIQSCS